MPYLPLALVLAERYLASGRIVWLALLALCLGLQWTWPFSDPDVDRRAGDLDRPLASGLRSPAVETRRSALIAAAGWGAALAAVQLGSSWQFAELGRPDPTIAQRAALLLRFRPRTGSSWRCRELIRELPLGPEDPYWFGQQTWGYEAALYMGTIPLILAFIGVFGRPASRSTMPVADPRAGQFRAGDDAAVVAARLSCTCSLCRDRLFPRARAVHLAHEPRPGRPGRRGIRSLDLDGAVSPGPGRRRWSSAVVRRRPPCLWATRPDVHLRPALGGMPAGIRLGASCLARRAVVIVWPGVRAGSRLGPAGRRRGRAGNPLLPRDNPMGLGDRAPRAEPGPHRAGAPVAGGPDRRSRPRTCRSAPAWEPHTPTWVSRSRQPNKLLVALQERLVRGDATRRARSSRTWPCSNGGSGAVE